MAVSIRRKQIEALRHVINLNQPLPHSSAAEPVWKILIFDQAGQDIISPLLSIKELRELGVTLHLNLPSSREALPDVPAVYFVNPTEENIRRISQDFISGLYDSYYLNFISSLSRPRLEELASAAVTHGAVDQVQKVFDQYLNFISLEDDLFALQKTQGVSEDLLSYYSLNRGSVTDVEMEQMTDAIVDSLFSICVTLGSVPIIRSPKGNIAELVAEKLDKKLRDNLRDARNNLFTSDNIRAGQISFQRPVLVILDRNVDLATPLHHTWTYQALVHDLLDLELNRVVVQEGGKVKEYDLNITDKFWMSQKGNPFPQVAEAVQEELEVYRTKEDEIKKLKSAMGLDSSSDAAITLITDTTEKLTSTVSSLPELLEKKRLIDMHTNIATAVLDKIKHRKLDEYFENEERLLVRQAPTTPLIDLLKNPEFGSTEDRLRLFIIHYICGDVSENDVTQYTAALEETGCDVSCLKYLKRWKMFAHISTDTFAGSGTKTVSMFSKLLNQSSQLVMEGVKNLVIKKHNLPVTRIVDSIMELKSNPDVEGYRYFDPKLLRVTDSNAIPRNRSPFQEAVVFMVGGGNYIEYQNLVDYAKAKGTGPSAKRITYGTTEMTNASGFLAQLTRLGTEAS